MKRRNFIRNVGALTSAPLMLNGLGVNAFATSQMIEIFNTCTGVEDRAVVIVFLKGGNDGLNTLIPLDQYDTYKNLRPVIGLDNYAILDSSLSIQQQVGLHPSAIGFKEMYEEGKARIIQGVGYPNFSQSHFKASDLWLGGRDGNFNSATIKDGWVGRFLENAYPGIHGNPTSNFPDPLGLQFGDKKASLLYHDCSGAYEAVNVTDQNLSSLFGLLNGLGAAPHTTSVPFEYGEQIDYIMSVENSTNIYGERISQVYNAGSNSSTPYSSSDFAQQMKRIARLLSGGSKTKVFNVHKNGFDTHGAQVLAGNPEGGFHASLLEDVFQSIKAFHDDLTNLGQGKKVMTVVFSEFSRRITENISKGTDHGNFGPMFVFGDGVNPGITGNNVNISNLDSQGNLLVSEMQLDYRSVFRTVLQDWMGAGADILGASELDAYPEIAELVSTELRVDPSCYIGSTVVPAELLSFEVLLNHREIVDITWEVGTEVNVDLYEVERKSETRIEEIVASSNADGSSYYQSEDQNPLEGHSYYRLKTVNLDGSIQYSAWKTVRLYPSQLKKIKIYPNPAKFDINVAFTTEKNIDLKIEIINAKGQRYYLSDHHMQMGFNKLNIDLSNFAVGTYIIHIIGINISEQRQIVKI